MIRTDSVIRRLRRQGKKCLQRAHDMDLHTCLETTPSAFLRGAACAYYEVADYLHRKNTEDTE